VATLAVASSTGCATGRLATTELLLAEHIAHIPAATHNVCLSAPARQLAAGAAYPQTVLLSQQPRCMCMQQPMQSAACSNHAVKCMPKKQPNIKMDTHKQQTLTTRQGNVRGVAGSGNPSAAPALVLCPCCAGLLRRAATHTVCGWHPARPCLHARLPAAQLAPFLPSVPTASLSVPEEKKRTLNQLIENPAGRELNPAQAEDSNQLSTCQLEWAEEPPTCWQKAQPSCQINLAEKLS
jgi:hypothetical protein